jgi:nitrile hydratase
MNGVHDLGGMHGFGPVEREENEPVFHGHWEAVMVAINNAARVHGVFNLDEFRHGIERMGNARYLDTSYYEHWLAGIERLLIEKGAIDPAALDARTEQAQAVPDALPREIASGPLTPPAPRTLHPFRRDPAAPARFTVGDTVETRVMQPRGHTRLPRYARGKRGVVDRVPGVFVYPDTNAHGRGEEPQWVYSVRFSAAELWGDTAEAGAAVYLDVWESYLV